ncbi:MAG: molybdopterin molybdenumtransferase MoeA, partial [Chitinophagaceae bacterium]
MISVAEARSLIDQNVEALAPVCLPLLQAANAVLAQNVVARCDIPAFFQSSMDGYAFCFGDTQLPL